MKEESVEEKTRYQRADNDEESRLNRIIKIIEKKREEALCT